VKESEQERPDLEGLRAFVNRSDREAPLFFVGRKRQTSQIAAQCRKAMDEHENGGRLVGSTILLTGAPGGGKTSIQKVQSERWLAQERKAVRQALESVVKDAKDRMFSRQAVEEARAWAMRGLAKSLPLSSEGSRVVAETFGNGRRDPCAGIPIPVKLDSGMLGNSRNVVRKIARAIAPRLETMFRTTEAGADDVADFVKAAALKGSADKTTAPPEANFDSLADALRSADLKRPICLMIDEVQNLKEDAGDILESLHLNTHDIPILAVCAGLGNSLQHLKNLNVTISRFSDVGPNSLIHDIGCLEEGETREAVERMVRHFRVRTNPEATRTWARRIEDESDGWPQHLHNGMRALAIGILENGGSLVEASEERVTEIVRRYRDDAYERRISDEIRSARIMIGKLMKKMPATGMIGTTMEAFFMRESRSRNEPGSEGFRLPKHVDAGQFVNHLIKQGVIHDYGRHNCMCPIPSFKAYLREAGGENIRKSASLGDETVIAYMIGNGTNPDEPDEKGETPMHHAARDGMILAMAALKEHGADIGKPTGRTFRTPIHEAAEAVPQPSQFEDESEAQAKDRRQKTLGRQEAVSWLISEGAAVDPKDKWGNTPLHLATQKGNVPVARLLVAAGADKAVQNAMGKMPVDLADDEELRRLAAPGDP